MSVDRFFTKYPKYNNFRDNTTFEEMYNWLSEPLHIHQMIEVCKKKKPALEAVIEEFLQAFGTTSDVPFVDTLEQSGSFNRQMIGAVVKEILWDYGMRQTYNLRFSTSVNGAPFKSGTTYEMKKESASKELVIEIKINQLREPDSFLS